MKILHTFAAARSETGPGPGLVPTMGYLHEGHLSLVALVREAAVPVVMSLFVNPLQFDEPADLERYPRDLERDAELAADAGVDVLFAPGPEEMYPEIPHTRVRVGGVTEGMEGSHRPGHFDGVATVVAKLLAGLQPAAAAFGRKDAQQLAVVRRMAADLSFPVRVLGGPTVRDPDGLALSTRNVFLDGAGRGAALGLSRGLFAAADAAEAGERSGEVLAGIVATAVEAAGASLEYAVLADAATAQEVYRLDRQAFLAVAARVGPVRLIDNVFLGPDGTADRGLRLAQPSMLRRE